MMRQALVSAPDMAHVLELPPQGLPKAPVFGWDNLRFATSDPVPSIGDLAHRAYTTSGRAALHLALLHMRLPRDTPVLVPTYHCPTMVAPIVHAGLRPLFYPLNDDGSPNLSWLSSEAISAHPGALFVPHYFGLARSLAATLDWCRAHGVLMVEDCAHSYFGIAGDRPVGRWGDYATASLSKFFPVPEAGLLARAAEPLSALGLTRASLPQQVKAAWDVVDFGCAQGRLAGLSHALWPVRFARDRRRGAGPLESAADDAVPTPEAIMNCDMARCLREPTAVAVALHRWLPTGRVVARRRANYERLASALSAAPGARVMAAVLEPGWVPYAMPLWVDGGSRADRVYASLRAERLPVFRWDRLWPSTPTIRGDAGARWSRHLLQLLCHQDLAPGDVQLFGQRVLSALHSSTIA